MINAANKQLVTFVCSANSTFTLLTEEIGLVKTVVITLFQHNIFFFRNNVGFRMIHRLFTIVNCGNVWW